MAKRAKRENGEGDSTRRGNGYDPEAVKSFVSRVETLKAEEALLKTKHKEELEPLKSDIDAVIAEAVSVGIPKKELKRKLRAREYQRRAELEREKLTPTEQTNYDNLSLALGELRDLPLGAAALASARPTSGATGHA